MSRWTCQVSGGSHTFRHKDDYCISCERRIHGAAEPHRRPKPVAERTDYDVLEVEPLRIDTSHAQDDYYDSGQGLESPAPDSLTEHALRQVMGE